MSKIMSVFEKLNLLEKTNTEKFDLEKATEKKVVTSSVKDVNVEKKSKVNKDHKENERKNEVEHKATESHNKDIKPPEKVQIKQNKKHTIQEIYTSYNIENSEINNIFMLGNFINALPESLPWAVRKKSVTSIVDLSNLDLIKLLGDGKKRVDILNKFSSSYHTTTINAVEEYKKKIDELKNQIKSCEEQIQVNETLLKEQNNTIKYEMDKIENIIDFFKDGE